MFYFKNIVLLWQMQETLGMFISKIERNNASSHH